MANKRKAHEAFATSAVKKKSTKAERYGPSLDAPQSAFAAFNARKEESLATAIGEEPYDGHYSESPTPEPQQGADQRQPLFLDSVRLSNFSSRPVVQKDGAIQLVLKADEYVTAVGEFEIEVESGLISLYGAMLTAETAPTRAYCLTIAALPQISARKRSQIRLKPVASMTQKLEKYSPLYRNVGISGTDESFQLINDFADVGRPILPLAIDEDIKKVLSRVTASLEAKNERHRIMAIGPKSSGKSTLTRLLCNMITSRPSQSCLYLDLDPGQPEFGPPGQLSLVDVHVPIIGPPSTHPASRYSKPFTLIRAHTIAATSFKDDSDHYINCAVDLIQHAPNDAPIIINSCGWVTGLGATTLVELVRLLRVSETIMLQPIDSQMESEVRSLTKVHHISRRQIAPSVRAPAELRAMQTMAYFHSRVSSDGLHITWSGPSIDKLRPWIVSYAGEQAGITAIMSYHQAPHPDFLAEAINGMLVGVVVIGPDSIESESIQRTANEGLPYVVSLSAAFSQPLDPRRSHCIGVAFVRGISTESRQLQLVTPLTEAQICDVSDQNIILVRGSYDTPEWAYLEGLYAGQHGALFDERVDSPWISTREGDSVGVEGAIWRLRHPPTR